MSSTTTNNTCIIYGTGCASPTNLPSYIDDQACLCGLLESRSSLPNNGEHIELWRCIGNASDNVEDGGNGKWYNTSLPSQELSGINQPQNWGENPPDLSQAYVLQDENGQAVYEELGSAGSINLIGSDKDCTGINDTSMSEQYYARGNGVPKSSSTSTSLMPTAQSATKTSATESTMQTASPSAAAAPPKGDNKSSAIHQVSLKSTFLLGMVLAPLLFGLPV
ncbi:hypothetical protein HO133_005990 [Letharia lupina]|uniref:Uncharacterized protein n=1 Tax=Letharia lupina TaxID=560253 RepID=A0A8H6C863_9LECA|nr:uncharacterized protein HO133_005990 [Letharia lupina]KAF6218639.1 hypothetical protein HO133_005990 [Letharia lupina]